MAWVDDDRVRQLRAAVTLPQSESTWYAAACHFVWQPSKSRARRLPVEVTASEGGFIAVFDKQIICCNSSALGTTSAGADSHSLNIAKLRIVAEQQRESCKVGIKGVIMSGEEGLRHAAELADTLHADGGPLSEPGAAFDVSGTDSMRSSLKRTDADASLRIVSSTVTVCSPQSSLALVLESASAILTVIADCITVHCVARVVEALATAALLEVGLLSPQLWLEDPKAGGKALVERLPQTSFLSLNKQLTSFVKSVVKSNIGAASSSKTNLDDGEAWTVSNRLMLRSLLMFGGWSANDASSAVIELESFDIASIEVVWGHLFPGEFVVDVVVDISRLVVLTSRRALFVSSDGLEGVKWGDVFMIHTAAGILCDDVQSAELIMTISEDCEQAKFPKPGFELQRRIHSASMDGPRRALDVWLATIGQTTKDLDTGRSLNIACPWDVPVPTLDALSRLHEQFSAIDTSGDGNIDEDELVGALGPLFPVSSFVALFFRAFDADGNGNISFLEFTEGLSELLSQNQIARLRFSFRMFDENHDGTIDEDELFKVLQTLSSTADVSSGSAITDVKLRSTATKLFSIMDVDRSGTILVDEYLMSAMSDPVVYDALCEVGLSYDKPVAKVRMRTDARDLILIRHPDWKLTTVLLHALLVTNQEEESASEPRDAQTPPELDHAAVPLNFTAHCVDIFAEGAGSVAPTRLEEYFSKRKVDFTPTEAEAAAGQMTKKNGKCKARCDVARFFLTTYASEQFAGVRRAVGLGRKKISESLGVHNLAGNMVFGSDRVLHRLHDTASASPTRFIFATHDYALIVRSASPTEVANMLENAGAYSQHVVANPDTLLTKIIGLYSVDVHTATVDLVSVTGCAGNTMKVHSQSAQHMFFTVAVNNMRHESPLRAAYFFKGYGRESGPSSDPMFMTEADLREPIVLSEDWAAALHAQLLRDTEFLANCGMHGYTVVVGHDEDEVARCKRCTRSITIGAGKVHSMTPATGCAGDAQLQDLLNRRDDARRALEMNRGKKSRAEPTFLGRLFSCCCLSATAAELREHSHKQRAAYFGSDASYLREERICSALSVVSPGATNRVVTGRGMSATFGLPAWWESAIVTGRLHLKFGGLPADDEIHTVVVVIASPFAQVRASKATSRLYAEKLRDFLRLVLLSSEQTESGSQQQHSREGSTLPTVAPVTDADMARRVVRVPALRESGSRCDIVIETFHQRVSIVNPTSGKQLMIFDGSKTGGLSVARMASLQAPRDLLLFRDVLQLDMARPEFYKLRILRVADPRTADTLAAAVFDLQHIERSQVPAEVCVGVASVMIGDTAPANLWAWLRTAWDPTQADVVVVAAQSVAYTCDAPTNDEHFAALVAESMIGFTCLERWSVGGCRLLFFANAVAANMVSNIQTTILAAGAAECPCDCIAVTFKLLDSSCGVVNIDLSKLHPAAGDVAGELDTMVAQAAKSTMMIVDKRIGSRGVGVEVEMQHMFMCVALPQQYSLPPSNTGGAFRGFVLAASPDDLSADSHVQSRVLVKSSAHQLDRAHLTNLCTEVAGLGRASAATFVRSSFIPRTPWNSRTRATTVGVTCCKLLVSNIKGHGLQRVSSIGLSTPSMTFHFAFAKQTVSTPAIPHTLDPSWSDATFEIPLVDGIDLGRMLEAQLFIEVHDRMLDARMGEGCVSMDKLAIEQAVIASLRDDAARGGSDSTPLPTASKPLPMRRRVCATMSAVVQLYRGTAVSGIVEAEFEVVASRPKYVRGSRQ